MSDRVLSLAGMFQATELVRQAALHGTWSGYAASTCLNSLLSLESDSVNGLYGGPARLRVGLEALESILEGENRHIDALRYSVGLLQLERHFRRNESMQAAVGATLAKIAHDGEDLPHHEREDQQASEIARLYRETISTVQPRIVVNGKPQHLETPRTVDWIRTLLFAGLRSAVLWRQVGGGRLSLLFGRRKLLEEVRGELYG